MTRHVLPSALALVALSLALAAQEAVATRSPPPQESAPVERDNLVHRSGTVTVPLGTLGRVELVGHGPRKLVLFPGFGLGGEVYRAFAQANRERYTMLLVTPAGNGDTPPPKMPPPGTRYRERSWCRAVEDGTWRLVKQLGWEQPVLAGHLGGFQHALRLAVDHPDEVGAVVSIGGELYRNYGQPMTPEQRAEGVDAVVAEGWFQTVSDETWEQGMGSPAWHSADEALGQALFDASLVPAIPTQVRYFCEQWSLDEREAFAASGVPTLALLPDLEAGPEDPMYAMFVGLVLVEPWQELASHEHVQTREVEGARLGLLQEHVAELGEAMAAFLDELDERGGG
jgi:pimeloyl-ACP methyl ester carboxylesterase